MIAMIVFTRLTPGAAYATHILPGLILMGIAMGCIFGPSFATATLGINHNEAGVASAMVNTSQQIGGSVGIALLSTLFATAAASYAAGHAHVRGLASAASVHGYTTAFWWAAGIFALGLLIALLVLPAKVRTRAPSLKPSLATE
jgi:MFS family permease